MKKRTLILLVAALLTCLLVAGCEGTYSAGVDGAATEMASFKVIEGKEYLVYSVDTRVVYYMFSTWESILDVGYGYMAPYISENGNFCRYINDEIVEITEVETNN